MAVSPFAQRYAHTLPDRPHTEWEPLHKHLDEVATSAAGFAAVFGAGDWADLLGRCHDLGKGSDEFQRYIGSPNTQDAANAGAEDATRPGRVDHSTFGARYLAKAFGGLTGQLLAFCIAGHHAGLSDWSAGDDASAGSTLESRLDARNGIPHVEDPGLRLIPPAAPFKWSSIKEMPFQMAFLTRMLFSTLVDADRTCTEAFCTPEAAEERHGARPTLVALRDVLDAHLLQMQQGAPMTPVNQQRHTVLQQCRAAATLEPGFFSLQVPTGGGKTLSSLAFALHHATGERSSEAPALHRVIVAIPFTSIIEQTAAVYRKALGPLAERALVEHHSSLQPETETRANQLAVENWDAPLIVTTNVQLLETLFAAKTTPCRKLHRIAGSVIILDEAQTLPVELLEPTLIALRELVRNYGCTVVLCTATQPALERRADFNIGIEGVRPIIADPRPLFESLKRVTVDHVGKLTDEDLVARLAKEPQVLCIVNTRPHAAKLFRLLSEAAEPDSCFHLSTLMCGAHRRVALWCIRRRVAAGKPCRIVSTQLIEAGVDIDLPVVYRAATGFDSIAQAAGRCNREGKLPMKGHTHVFDTESEPPPGFLRESRQAGLECFSRFDDPLEPAAIEAYFERLYWGKRDEWDKHKILRRMQVDHRRHQAHFQFREIADAYRLIKNAQLPILVPFGRKAKHYLDELGKGYVEFVPQRQLQPYLVSVPERTLRTMEASGVVRAHESGVWLLLREDVYMEATGLKLDAFGLDPTTWGV